MRVMGIETSCDETGIAIYDEKNGIISHCLHSQVDLHQLYGGVVPELAARDHISKISLLVKQALREANCEKVDAVAYTSGPGLVGALLVGAAFGRSLAYGWSVPALSVHHMEAHLLAPMLEAEKPEFPFIALLVSGGHTQLVLVKALGDYLILGESVDDAAGEAFDKTAKLLDLGYPGGPKVAAMAAQAEPDHGLRFPRPMVDRPGLDFSYSGLKTFAANTFAASDKSQQAKANICDAFEVAVIDTLLIKCRRALKEHACKNLVLAGGVSANRRLRGKVKELMTEMGGQAYYPRAEYCTDNGAMVAFAGYCRLKAQAPERLAIKVRPRWPMSELS